MRILLLTQVLPYPPDSGPKAKTWNVLKWVARQHDVTLVSFVRGDQSDAVHHLEHYCRAVHTVPMARSIWRDLAYLGLSVWRQEPFLMSRDDRAVMRRLVDQVAAATPFDVVHADQLNMAQYGERVRGARKILDAHNALWLLYKQLSETMNTGPKKWLLRREWLLLKAYEGYVSRNFDATVVVSDDDRIALQEAMDEPGRMAVIPIAVDTEELPVLQRRRGANRIVYIGTMSWPPNVDGVRWFLRAVYPRIRERRPDVAVDIIGVRPPRAIRALARPDTGINVLGYVEDLVPYLESAGVLVVPLRAGSGMRVKILNGLAHGLPIVSTSVGASGIAVEAGRHLLIADTPADFAAATLRVLDDDALAEQLGRNGRRFVEVHHDYRLVCPRLLDAYQNDTRVAHRA